MVKRTSDRSAYSQFAKADMTRFLVVDLGNDRLRWSMDEDAVAGVELLYSKLTLITKAPDLTLVEEVPRYKDLAEMERGFEQPDRGRAHALLSFSSSKVSCARG